jgi:6-phosphogluconolactonase/glucosamine-6-phosphate isomerase/deaminase
MFLAAGADKREAVRASTQPEIDEHTPPAGLVRPTRGELLWFVDRAAAGA